MKWKNNIIINTKKNKIKKSKISLICKEHPKNNIYLLYSNKFVISIYIKFNKESFNYIFFLIIIIIYIFG